MHRDDNDEKEIKKKDKSVPSVLKSIKTTAIYEDDNFASAPLFYPEPYDPTKFSMYCKEQVRSAKICSKICLKTCYTNFSHSQVYAGGIEFQFEELRAIQYKRKRQQELILKTSKVPKAIESISVASQQTHSQPLKTKIESHSKTKNDKAKSKVTETNDKKEKNRNEPRRKNLISNPAPNTVPEASCFV